ncbi:MAG: Fic family protein [Leptospirillia bacterium]
MSEDYKKILGFFWDPGAIPSRESLPFRGTNEALFRLRKILSEFVFRDAYLEGNPLTYPEVSTLMDGISVGGRKVSDVEQVLNLRNAWNRAEILLSRTEFSLSKEIFCEINGLVAQNEALAWGEFRTGNVGIGGTTWIPPDWHTLPERFEKGLEKVVLIENPLERAMVFSLWTARVKFFFDGNKRTGRIMLSAELMKNGLDAISIPDTSRQTFNEKMIRFYETGDATDMMMFYQGLLPDLDRTEDES